MKSDTVSQKCDILCDTHWHMNSLLDTYYTTDCVYDWLPYMDESLYIAMLLLYTTIFYCDYFVHIGS